MEFLVSLLTVLRGLRDLREDDDDERDEDDEAEAGSLAAICPACGEKNSVRVANRAAGPLCAGCRKPLAVADAGRTPKGGEEEEEHEGDAEEDAEAVHVTACGSCGRRNRISMRLPKCGACGAFLVPPAAPPGGSA